MKNSSGESTYQKIQQLVIDKLTKITGLPNGPDEMIFPRPMGHAGTDIVLKGKARKLIGFAFECEGHEKFSMQQWIRQSQNNDSEGLPWCVIIGKKNFNPFVTMDILSFKSLLKFKTRKRFEKLFFVYEFFHKNWKMERWVNDARRRNHDKPWLIISHTDSKRVVSVDLDVFIDLLEYRVGSFNEIA